MPQKKNPDLFELARGKSGSLTGLLTGLLVTLKGLPSSYDKDLQEDKLPVFTAADTLRTILPVLAGALRTMTVHPERMRTAIDPTLMATDLAEHLVRKGVPFREAHGLTGQAVRAAAEKGCGLDQLCQADWQALGLLEADLLPVFDPLASVEKKSAIGGTAPQAVLEQIQNAKIKLRKGKGE